MRHCISTLCMVFAFSFAATAQTPIFVNHAAIGANNGTSWANAYTDLQTAIDSAAAGSELWVAAGVYRPSKIPFNGTLENYKTFLITKTLSLYGGFSGNETARTQRLTTDTTTLSGRLNDSVNVSQALTIFTKENDSVIVNRFKICDSRTFDDTTTIVFPDSLHINSFSTTYGGYGAAVEVLAQNRSKVVFFENYITGNGTNSSGISDFLATNFTGIDSSFIKLYNNTFIANYGTGCQATTGRDSIGYNDRSFIEISGNQFIGNGALGEVDFITSYGGGLSIPYGNVLIDKNLFSGNRALFGGGLALSGYYFHSGDAPGEITVTNNTFSKNTSVMEGGGLWMTDFHNIGKYSFTYNQFIENRSLYTEGGGLFIVSRSSIESEIAYNTIIKNEAVTGGGGMSIFIDSDSDNIKIQHNRISENRANDGDGGGILINPYGSIWAYSGFSSNTITNNWASNNGGGVFCNNAIILNNIISGNTAGADGGAIYLTGTESGIINNLIASNFARRAGGVYAIPNANQNGLLSLINNTIVNNRADTVGGLYTVSSGYAGRYGIVAAHNNLVWGNGDNFYYINNSLIESNNNLIENVSATMLNAFGNNNLDGTTANTQADSSLLFTDYAAADYTPAPTAITINAGSDALYRLNPIDGDSLDLVGNPRFFGAAIDIGAYEYPKSASTDAQVISLSVNDNSLLDRPTSHFAGHYEDSCNEGSFRVQIAVSDNATLSIAADTTIVIDALAGLDTLRFTVTAESGVTTTHFLVLEKRFDFDLVVATLWQTNTFMLDIAGLQREGFDFYYSSPYQWYRNDAPIDGATLPTYSAGPQATDRLDAASGYHLALTRLNGEVLRTCVNYPTETTPAGVALYPNPATAGLPFTLLLDGIATDTPLQASVYNSLGQIVAQQTMTTNTLSMSLPTTGLYLLVIHNSRQERIAETKIIVKK